MLKWLLPILAERWKELVHHGFGRVRPVPRPQVVDFLLPRTEWTEAFAHEIVVRMAMFPLLACLPLTEA